MDSKKKKSISDRKAIPHERLVATQRGRHHDGQRLGQSGVAARYSKDAAWALESGVNAPLQLHLQPHFTRLTIDLEVQSMVQSFKASKNDIGITLHSPDSSSVHIVRLYRWEHSIYIKMCGHPLYVYSVTSTSILSIIQIAIA